MPKRSASQRAPAAEWRPHSDRLSVITAGRVGNMEARLGASGFDVVAVAETEDALIDAVSADEPDAIVVEADLCASLEHVRDLAPDAVLIVVGDHTPAGALGRIERGVSGTAMAGLLHALVAEGAGAAVVWGLVPAFRPRGAMHVPMRMGGSLLSAKADLIRAYVANALGDHAELVTAASTVAVTVSASLVLTLGAPRTHERPERVSVPAPAVEHAPQHPVIAMSPTTRHPVVAVSPTTRTPAHGPSTNEGEPGDRREPTRGESRDHGRHDDQGEDQDNDDQGEDQDNDDQGEDQDNDDQGEDQDNDDQGENADQVEDESEDADEDADDESEDADEDADDESEDAAARARRTRGTRRTGHRRLDHQSSPEVLPAHRRWVGPPSWEFDAQ
jgi:hypothetical protein